MNEPILPNKPFCELPPRVKGFLLALIRLALKKGDSYTKLNKEYGIGAETAEDEFIKLINTGHLKINYDPNDKVFDILAWDETDKKYKILEGKE